MHTRPTGHAEEDPRDHGLEGSQQRAAYDVAREAHAEEQAIQRRLHGQRDRRVGDSALQRGDTNISPATRSAATANAQAAAA